MDARRHQTCAVCPQIGVWAAFDALYGYIGVMEKNGNYHI